MFDEPALATSYPNALESLSQTGEQTILSYMHSLKILKLRLIPTRRFALGILQFGLQRPWRTLGLRASRYKKKLTTYLGTLISNSRNLHLVEKPPEKKKATRTIKCFGCVQYSHFKSDCPRLNHLGSRAHSTRPSFKCLLF